MNKLHISVGSGKMEGINSINTPATENPFCIKMKEGNGICKSCYAFRYENMRPVLRDAIRRNVKVLKSTTFEPYEVNEKVIRFHSFGELHNTQHFINFVKMAFFNPSTQFTLWTKRSNIVQGYLRDGGIIPSNMIMIYSNPVINKGKVKVPKGFDKVFNVFRKKYIEDNNIDINCGSRSCKDCMVCYSVNDVTVINEKIK